MTVHRQDGIQKSGGKEPAMRRLLHLVVLVLLLCSPAVLAQQAAQDSAQQATVNIPQEYKAFFDEFSALAKKYPDAARRFGIFDNLTAS